MCARVGLTEDDIDVAELTDQVRGFSLARQVSIRGGLELLAVAYNFDGVESDGQLKFTKRGSSSIRVITQDELAYISDPDSPVPELFRETRAQDVDLPARFTVRYNDIERDSDIGVQTWSTIVGTWRPGRLELYVDGWSRVTPVPRRRQIPAPCSASTAGAGASRPRRTSTATSRSLRASPHPGPPWCSGGTPIRSASCVHGTRCLRSWGVRHPPRPSRPARAWSPF